MGPAQTRSPIPLERFHSLCFPLCRPLPPVQQTQREARQATFLFRRGLKVLSVNADMDEIRPDVSQGDTFNILCAAQVQAQVQKTNLHTPPFRTRQ